ncbi:type II secretion system F family protein [Thiohalomonas denitrificans]|uniref:MSHA biogenesis protein MshG n=1 Tax=Thiohalomonas denitrificans TaxID=415747 RepID=A0A1G5QTQ0_9GAMM|nr:type II secretion system F family protein [Thiohalomonas denitrificans]SCZ65132.1 MSHA biogenesis protein MshG [Thiohalomonas denitrificans]
MPLFEYTARDGRGGAVTGRIESSSADAVASQLLNSGITPVHISEAVPRRDYLAELRRHLGSGRPNQDDLLLFCRQMYTLTKSGVPIVRGLTGLAESTRNAVLAESLQQIRTELEAGRDLSGAMAQHPKIFSPLMVSMVRVGESTGQLDEAFERLSRYLEQDRDTRSRIKTALRYPTIVLVFIAAAIGVVNVIVIPAFAKVFAGMGSDLPWQTKLLMALSDFSVAFWPHILMAIILTVLAVRSYVHTPAGRYRWDHMKLGLPIVGSIISRAILARFARTFAMTTRSGVPLIQALGVVARAVNNEYVSERVINMRSGVERGDTLTRTAAATGLFTPLILQMLSVGEETGRVEDMMDEVAGFYEREVEHELKSLTSAIEPILIVAVGILVLILALGVFLPMWDLTQLAG